MGWGGVGVGLIFMHELSMLVEHNSFFKQRQNCKYHDSFILKALCLIPLVPLYIKML